METIFDRVRRLTLHLVAGETGRNPGRSNLADAFEAELAAVRAPDPAAPTIVNPDRGTVPWTTTST
jgi:hypothetical protein